MRHSDNGVAKNLVRGAAVAGVYAALSLAFAPISYGLMQVRVSEALTVLPRYTGYAAPGLFVGCLLANLIGMALGLSTIADVALGSLATLLAALLSARLKEHRWLVPLPPVLVNAVVIGWELCYVFNVGAPLWLCMAYVGAGQLISCYALGIPLSYALDKVPGWVFA